MTKAVYQHPAVKAHRAEVATLKKRCRQRIFAHTVFTHRAEVAALKKAALQPIKDAAKAARRSERNRKVLR